MEKQYWNNASDFKNFWCASCHSESIACLFNEAPETHSGVVCGLQVWARKKLMCTVEDFRHRHLLFFASVFRASRTSSPSRSIQYKKHRFRLMGVVVSSSTRSRRIAPTLGTAAVFPLVFLPPLQLHSTRAHRQSKVLTFLVATGKSESGFLLGRGFFIIAK